MAIQKIPITVSNNKGEGRWGLNLEDIPFPQDFKTDDSWIIFVGAGKSAGNHKHSRVEALIGIGEGLKFFYVTVDGEKHEELMNPNGEFYLIVIPSFLPHAVTNDSNKDAVILEFTNDRTSESIDSEVINA